MFSTVPGVTKCEVMNERHSNQNNDKLRNQHNEQFLLALNHEVGFNYDNSNGK